MTRAETMPRLAIQSNDEITGTWFRSQRAYQPGVVFTGSKRMLINQCPDIALLRKGCALAGPRMIYFQVVVITASMFHIQREVRACIQVC